jgi:PhzF family phenazine biosynthesis protein
MAIPIFQVDAFTDRPFAGNPAAVCLLPGARDAGWMQGVAAEMNLSETAFLLQRDGRYDLRWFTPTIEVDLCGHATLASAHVLWESGELLAGRDACFQTRSGLLVARQASGWIEMDLPADPPHEIEPPAGLVGLLGCNPIWVGKGRFDLFVEVDSEETVRALQPDLRALAALPYPGMPYPYRGLVVTARPSSASYDFVSRFFGPAAGIDEDPVTGSAHCSLGPYWRSRLGRDELVGFQASARGGEVRVRPAGERVILAGKAITVLRGELLG